MRNFYLLKFIFENRASIRQTIYMTQKKRPSTLARLITPVLVVVLGLSSCATMQSPKVLEKSEQSFTIGAVILFPLGGAWFDVHAAFRTHLVDQLDAGIQISYNWATMTAVIDAKYQIIGDPAYLAGSLGVGVIGADKTIAGDFDIFDFDPIMHILFVGGRDSFYGGLKGVINLSSVEKRIDSPGIKYGSPFTGIITAGGEFGEKDNLIIEANMILHKQIERVSEEDNMEPIFAVGGGYRSVF
jgi:hypothetical protein